jgi:hypothetical protein
LIEIQFHFDLTMSAPRIIDSSKMESRESFLFLSFLLDSLPAQALHPMITGLWNGPFPAFRSVIGQWLDSGHFSSTYYIGEKGLQWESGKQSSDIWYKEVELVYLQPTEDSKEEAVLGKRARSSSLDLSDSGTSFLN